MAQTGAAQRGIEQAPDRNKVRPFTKKFPKWGSLPIAQPHQRDQVA